MTRKSFLSNLLKLRCTIPMILLAFAADFCKFVHCVDAFKSDVKRLPDLFLLEVELQLPNLRQS